MSAIVSGKEESVTRRTSNTERVGAFSDGVFAVIITIMVLELKPPEDPSFAALALLWPTALSYAVSYLFIAIIWVNHHYLLRLAEGATPQLIWWNFAHLFLVSLIPFSTAWIATSRMAAVPVFVYAAVFVLVNIAYLAFECEALSTAETRGAKISVVWLRTGLLRLIRIPLPGSSHCACRGRAPCYRGDSEDGRYPLTRAHKRGEIGDTDLEHAHALNTNNSDPNFDCWHRSCPKCSPDATQCLLLHFLSSQVQLPFQ